MLAGGIPMFARIGRILILNGKAFKKYIIFLTSRFSSPIVKIKQKFTIMQVLTKKTLNTKLLFLLPILIIRFFNFNAKFDKKTMKIKKK